MPQTASGRELPESYKAPTVDLYTFAESDFVFSYKLSAAGQVEYEVRDGFEGTKDRHTCTLHQFEMGMAASVDDGQLTGSEYEDAELSQGSLVRWIP